MIQSFEEFGRRLGDHLPTSEAGVKEVLAQAIRSDGPCRQATLRSKLRRAENESMYGFTRPRQQSNCSFTARWRADIVVP